jgi:hypothetical protein
MNDETFTILDDLLKFFSHKFPFGIHDSDDIYQQGWIFALEALKKDKYVEDRGSLKSYLFSVLYSRFINFKRNEYYRPETPCKSCPFNSPASSKTSPTGTCNTSSQYENASPCEVFAILIECPLYSDWNRRNTSKRSISSSSLPVSPDHISRDTSYIDLSEYPPHLRDLVARASTGGKLLKSEKKLLESFYESQ